MRLLGLVLILFISSCSKSKTEQHLAEVPAPILIIFSGESNSGGYGFNSQATPAELQPRASVQILNNFTMNFEDLKIGVNNKLGHTGNEYNWYTTHGWELQLANRSDGTLLNSPNVYLVKTGQGGSRISDWAEGGIYNSGAFTANCWDTMQKRVDTAIALLKRQSGKSPKIYLFYSQGINDAVSSTDIKVWETETKAHFSKIRVKYGNLPIIMTRFMSEFEAYNSAINDITATVDNCYAVTTYDAALNDRHHWSYEGLKLIADRMIDILIDL